MPGQDRFPRYPRAAHDLTIPVWIAALLQMIRNSIRGHSNVSSIHNHSSASHVPMPFYLNVTRINSFNLAMPHRLEPSTVTSTAIVSGSSHQLAARQPQLTTTLVMGSAVQGQLLTTVALSLTQASTTVMIQLVVLVFRVSQQLTIDQRAFTDSMGAQRRQTALSQGSFKMVIWERLNTTDGVSALNAVTADAEATVQLKDSDVEAVTADAEATEQLEDSDVEDDSDNELGEDWEVISRPPSPHG